MLDEEEIPDPKPLVEYLMLPEENDLLEPDILEKYEKANKLSLEKIKEFGKNKNIIDNELLEEIHQFHKVKQPEERFIPYDIDLEEDPGLVGPSIPKDFTSKPVDKGKIEIEENYDSDEEPIDKRVPVSHVVEMMHTEKKLLNSIDIDRIGNRMITGSHDGSVKIWDFSSMTRRPSAFHEVDAGEGLPVYAVSWAPSGGFFMASTGDCHAKVFDRDGNFEISCLKGDSYLHDISHTKGHTYPLTDGKWHPIERNLFITSSRDSTIRIWDIYAKPMGVDQELMQAVILRAKTYKNHKITIGCCNYSHDGNMIVGGVNDGSIQFWSSKGSYWKPDIYIKDAHKPNSELTGVLFSDDNTKLFSRGDDSTLRMWDLRMTKKTIHTWEHIPCFAAKSGISLSPDESIIVTGTSVKTGHENSSLQFYSTYDYKKIKEVKVCPYSISPIVWNEKLNQIAIGTTDGAVRMYFNPTYSKNGIVNTIYKKAKTREIDDFQYAMPVITPLVLPLFDETNFSRQTYLEKIKDETIPSHKAELPVQGAGSKFCRPPSVTQYIMNSVHKTLYKEGDARDMLLKFRSGNKGEWVDSAYKKTQPKPVFDHIGPLEPEVLYYEQKRGKKCPACGLKFCSCAKNIFTLPIPKQSAPKTYKNF
jgi:WD40 repeat protein